MAKKRHEPLQDPPTASLSEEESSEEASSSEDEEEEEEAKSPVQTSSGETESDNEPESETAVSPVVAGAASMKNTKRQRTEETTTSMSERQATKENDEKEIGTETTKKSYFQRLWSEEDDLVILQGMLRFKSETGKTHSEDMDGFYESVKDSITFEGKNLNRLVNKIRTLRTKYVTKRKKGVTPSFLKALDKKCFELSESIWGSEVESKMKKAKLESSEAEGGMVETDWIMNSFVGESIIRFGMDGERVKQKWSLLPVETKKKVYDKWKMLEYKSMEVVVQKTGFVREVASLLA